MNLFGFARKKTPPATAQTAKDRLQILLAHERSSGTAEADYLPMLQRDIVAAIRKHVPIGDKDVDVRMERGDNMSSLEINIDLPTLGEVLTNFALRGDVVAGLAQDRYRRLDRESRAVTDALAVLGTPVTLDGPSAASQAYNDAVSRLTGTQVEMRIQGERRPGLFQRLFGRAS